ncbi:O-antigen ligase family protein [Bradyrhizobium sp. Ai1a-2]|uniref:O-antigen ligase family protein n=1 Tax=Bradyrhizobium sp. Ai1a-2 TaxID=196490 RepID=UPI0004868076|nr:O-antigen ligase family protein [Bradyrhizobium sp. Ai1a-2]
MRQAKRLFLERPRDFAWQQCALLLFVALFAASPVAVLAHGLFATGSWFTGFLMVGSTAALLTFGRWREFEIDARDAIFCCLLLAIGISLALNGIGPDPKEFYLLMLTLAAYPAARLCPANVSSGGFILLTAAVVAAGTLVTIPSLIEQWSDPNHPKVVVFGLYDAAPAQFTMLLGFLLLSVTARRLTWRRTLLVGGLSAIPTFVFAACQVRFTFVAIAVTMLVAIGIANRARQRVYILVILGAIVVAGLGGGAARWGTTKLFVNYAIESATTSLRPGCASVDTRNSIDIRKQLYIDALRLLGRGDFFGIGFERFPTMSCIPGTQVHSAPLQVAVEFGPLASALFVILIAKSIGVRMYWLGRINPEARFVLAGVVFATILSLAHGRISREMPLFLLLGCAAAVSSRGNRFAMEWMRDDFKDYSMPSDPESFQVSEQATPAGPTERDASSPPAKAHAARTH